MSRIHDWSNLCPDLLRSVLKVLNSKDFHRARTVCSNWYSVSRTCSPPLYPWQILYQYRACSALLFDTGEDNIREIEHPRLDLSENYCIASSSSWLVMIDQRLYFSILNVFTSEMIDLPTMELSFLGFQEGDEWESFIERKDMIQSKKSANLWINERTRDFVVAWIYKRDFLFTYKKGDEMWQRILEGTKCEDMAFKDNKLYVLTSDNYIKILDMSGEIPRESLENPISNHRFSLDMGPRDCIWRRRVTITNSGEVLVIQSSRVSEEKFLFEIFKMNMESRKWERVDSIGDEMLIFGHGVTVRSSVHGGSICFGEDDVWLGEKSGVFDLATSTITWAKHVGEWDPPRWFVPGYA